MGVLGPLIFFVLHFQPCDRSNITLHFFVFGTILVQWDEVVKICSETFKQERFFEHQNKVYFALFGTSPYSLAESQVNAVLP